MGIWIRESTGIIDPQIIDFKNRVQVGDIIAVLNGQNPIALVEVIGDWYEFYGDQQPINKNSIIWFGLRRSVKILCLRGEDNGYIASLPQFPMRTKTLTISTTKTTDTYKYIEAWHKQCARSA